MKGKFLRSFCLFMMCLFALDGLAEPKRDKTLVVQVTAATHENLQGQAIILTQTDYALGYGNLVLDADGKCTVKVYSGNHSIKVERAGFETVTKNFIVSAEAAESSVNVELTEKVKNPFALTTSLRHNAYTGVNNLTFTWNTEAPSFFDDFESYDAFAVSFGNWSGIDVDKEIAAPLVGDYANRGVLQYAQIMNPLVVEPAWWYDYPVLRPYSGKQYVGFTRTNSGNANDDWLISPIITVGTNNVLSFMAKAADQFAEYFQVYVTTKIDEPQPSDFIRIDENNNEIADYTGWKEYAYDLSTYAGKQIKFAIRYVSEYNRGKSFMLMVDDVYVGQPKSSAKPYNIAKRIAQRSKDNPYESFEIYKDGELVGTTPDYSYVFENIKPGEYTLGVKAKYQLTSSDMISINTSVPGDDIYAHLSFKVISNSKVSADGQKLNLVNTLTSDTYQVTVSDGKADIMALPKGTYVINVEQGVFSEYQKTITVDKDMMVDVALTDNIINPYNITADIVNNSDGTTDAMIKWNQELLFKDSFEDYADFATGTFGNWKSLDIDKRAVYPIGLGSTSNIVWFPGAGSASKPAAIAPIVFNPYATKPAMLPTDQAVKAPTGDKSVVFFSPQGAKADKWLISPEVIVREGYIMQVTLKSYASVYPETIELCVSTEGDQPSDFSVVSTAANIPSEQWTRYEMDLAPYIDKKIRLGFHYVSYDTFFAQLDDVMVGPKSGEAAVIDYGNVVRYDIYVDNVKVGESATSAYTVKNLTAGSHTIGIQAIYNNGKSSLVEYVVNVVTGIEHINIGNIGKNTAVYKLSGQRTNGSLTALPKGIYIVKEGNKVIKISK